MQRGERRSEADGSLLVASGNHDAHPRAAAPYLLEMALLHRPGSYSTQQFSLVLAPVGSA